MARELTGQDRGQIDSMIANARAAMRAVAGYPQERIDRLCQALGWATANEKTFGRIVDMSIRESGLGDPQGRHSKRIKILGVLRDALRQKSTLFFLGDMAAVDNADGFPGGAF